MNELDFNDQPVHYRPTRIAPAVKSNQSKTPAKKTSYKPNRFREIERQLEQQRLERQLRDF